MTKYIKSYEVSCEYCPKCYAKLYNRNISNNIKLAINVVNISLKKHKAKCPMIANKKILLKASISIREEDIPTNRTLDKKHKHRFDIIIF